MRLHRPLQTSAASLFIYRVIRRTVVRHFIQISPISRISRPMRGETDFSSLPFGIPQTLLRFIRSSSSSRTMYPVRLIQPACSPVNYVCTISFTRTERRESKVEMRTTFPNNVLMPDKILGTLSPPPANDANHS